MMRLPPFEYRAPETVGEATRILSGEGPRASILAGGTDLLPNMKRRQQVPAVLVSLRRIPGLRTVVATPDGGLELGAGATLADIARAQAVGTSAPALASAARQVATPHLRTAATLGGNLCLDTRCTYYDQNYEWREAIGFCLKKDGETCWVAPSSKRCLAVSSSDCAPALLAIGAEVTLTSMLGERRIALDDLFRNDGIEYLARRGDEILTRIHVPPATGWRSTYWKLRRRGSIDFPVLGVAVAVKQDAAGEVLDARIALGAVASRPLLVLEAGALLRGSRLDDETIDAAAREAARPAKPMDNTDYELHWRKGVVRHQVAGALRLLRGDDASTLPLLARRCARAAAFPSA